MKCNLFGLDDELNNIRNELAETDAAIAYHAAMVARLKIHRGRVEGFMIELESMLPGVVQAERVAMEALGE